MHHTKSQNLQFELNCENIEHTQFCYWLKCCVGVSMWYKTKGHHSNTEIYCTIVPMVKYRDIFPIHIVQLMSLKLLRILFQVQKRGSVIQVKILGVMALIDEGGFVFVLIPVMFCSYKFKLTSVDQPRFASKHNVSIYSIL